MPIKKIVNGITVLSLFAITIFPLIVANSFFFPFITGKAFYFRLLVEIAFAGWVLLAFIDSKYRPRLTPMTIGVTSFVIIALIADLLGVNPIRSFWSNFERMEGWITIIHLWAFFLVSANFFGRDEEGRKMWHLWFNTSLFIATIVSIYGLTQLFGWTNIHQGSTRLDASLGNSAYLAVYMMIHAFVAMYMFFDVRLKKHNSLFLNWVYPVLAVLFAFIVFQTQTRGTILGLAGGIILALALFAIFANKEPKKYRLISSGIILLIILLGLSLWLNRNTTFVKNSEVLNRLASISIKDVKTQARGYIWPMAIKGAMERPILGWGQENFNYIFNANYEPKMYNQEQWFDRAHNVFLDWLVASGLVGLLAYLSLYVLLIITLWKSELNIWKKSVLIGLVVGYTIHNIFVFDNLASYVMFFSIIAFSESFNRKNFPTIFGEKHLHKDAIEWVVLPIVVVCLGFVLYFYQYRLVQANSRLIDAMYACNSNPIADLFEKSLQVNVYASKQETREQLMNCSLRVINSNQIPMPIKQGFFELTKDQIELQIAATPKDTRIYMLAGSYLNGISQFTDAVKVLEKAYALSPQKQSIAYELATSYLNVADQREKAVNVLKGAYDSTPDNSQARFAYATALVALGRDSEAKKIFGDDPTIFESVQVAQAYSLSKQYTKAIAVYKTLIKNNPTDVNYRAQLAQVQFEAGLKYDSILTLRALAEDRPDLKAQIEATIKQIEK